MTFQVNKEIEPWILDSHMRVDPCESGPSPRVTGTDYIGKTISILKIELKNASRVLAINPEDSFCFCIAATGSFRGVAGSREIVMSPNRFAFLLVPGEAFKIIPNSDTITAYVYRLSAKFLLDEAVSHGTLLPSLLSLQDTIPDHEQLILACSKQLLKFSSIGDDLSDLRLLEPLEGSIVSLLATLVGLSSDFLPKTSSDPPQNIHVDVALAYMEDNIKSDISLRDLCIKCSVSSRTLQVSFQTVMSKTPLQALMELRLNRLHDLLLQGNEVGNACDQVGLRHCGRISAKYKDLFGELPRNTRQRRF